MLPPTIIEVPRTTTAIYITAISLSGLPSTASVTWSDASATYGTTFVGPSASYVLGDQVFNSPITTITSGVPESLTVSFNFNDTMTTQHSVVGPTVGSAGPAGSESVVQISGFAAEDQEQKFPTTVTIVMKKPMGGILRQSG